MAQVSPRWPKMAQDGPRTTQDSAKMSQDSPKTRKHKFALSFLTPTGGHGTARVANNLVSQGLGESPPKGG